MDIQLPRQIGYASGNFGKSLMWTSLDYLLLFYLTEVAGIPVSWAGAIILLSLLWDAGINPFIGYWIDRRASLGRDYRPFLRWAPVAAAFGFVGLFWLPSQHQASNIAYLFLIMLGFRTAYGFLDVPHNALLAHMPVGPALRMRLAGMRFFFSSLGGLVVATLVAPQFSRAEPGSVRESLLSMAVIAGVVLCITVWQSLRPSRLAMAERLGSVQPLRPGPFARAILRDRTAMFYLAMAGVFALTVPLFAKILPYLLQYVREQPELLSNLLVALTLGQLVAMPIWTTLLERMGTHTVGLATFGGLAAVLVLAYTLAEAQFGLFCLATFALGVLLGGAIQIIWGLAGAVADHIAEQSLIRVDGGLLAFLTLVQKAALGVGAIVTGIALDASGFQSAVVQGMDAVRMIEVLGLVVPAAGAVAAALLFHRLSHVLIQK